MKLNIQFFGGRGARSYKQSSIKTYETGNFEGTTFKSKYITSKDGQTTGQLDYEITNNEVMVRMIRVYNEYKRKGYATKLLKDLQKEIGNKDINFDLVTKDGKALLDKVADITENKKGKYGGNYYKGRIKLK